ncbi:glyoxylase-like metal-dependent hydrolase (beta-lactamase superfamily II) [Plasticicumulans lactativorans]|uniref:Glyoxylase-like metal-dependent hydrolase (Beta-lactamase superfamily II) n=1 Tax=Plasticicumulans lactativorans TaxID=1133106 RepID=A0A4R2KXE4_9GAMM|nr:MBL fold metallo-hydrolase [Plasticicumulans lactativorans]TCO79261.1 glyoxylase-like metal-dependent hydrolase (beta-lactamase superfamily II) [Plasticicumulans lactativorans]
MSQKAFASQGDLEEKKVSFVKLADNAYAYTAEGDPNAGVIIGDDSVMVIDTLATPVMAQGLIDCIRSVTDKPIRHIVLTHYHAVRVLGAAAYGAETIIASQGTYELIRERGEADMMSEYGRFPRLFRSFESVPGLTWPNLVFENRMTLWLGKTEVRIMHLGRGHTKGDTVVWLPREKVLFAGDLVEYASALYTGDAYLGDWPQTLENLRALGAEKLVPGRGEALQNAAEVNAALDGTKAFIDALFGSAQAAVAAGKSLNETYKATYAAMQPRFGNWVIFDHCMPFDVTRAYDEASGIRDPRVWTAERDTQMWAALEG